MTSPVTDVEVLPRHLPALAAAILLYAGDMESAVLAASTEGPGRPLRAAEAAAVSERRDAWWARHDPSARHAEPKPVAAAQAEPYFRLDQDPDEIRALARSAGLSRRSGPSRDLWRPGFGPGAPVGWQEICGVPLTDAQRRAETADPAEWGGATADWLIARWGSGDAVEAALTKLSEAARAGHVRLYADRRVVPLSELQMHDLGIGPDGAVVLLPHDRDGADTAFGHWAAGRGARLAAERSDVLRVLAAHTSPPASKACMTGVAAEATAAEASAASPNEELADGAPAIAPMEVPVTPRSRGGRPSRYGLVAIAEGPLRTRLEQDGVPRPGDGRQTALEDWFIKKAEGRGHECSETTARKYVRREIARARASIG